MAQNITINGKNYSEIDNIEVPKSDNSGTANFVDTTDANATEEDIATGKTAYVNGVKLTGVGSMGGGANEQQGTYTYTSAIEDMTTSVLATFQYPNDITLVNPNDGTTEYNAGIAPIELANVVKSGTYPSGLANAIKTMCNNRISRINQKTTITSAPSSYVETNVNNISYIVGNDFGSYEWLMNITELGDTMFDKLISVKAYYDYKEEEWYYNYTETILNPEIQPPKMGINNDSVLRNNWDSNGKQTINIADVYIFGGDLTEDNVNEKVSVWVRPTADSLEKWIQYQIVPTGNITLGMKGGEFDNSIDIEFQAFNLPTSGIQSVYLEVTYARI